MKRLKPIAKGVAGGLAAALAFAIPLVDNGVTLSEGLGIASAFLAGLGIVYVAPKNVPADQ